MKFRSWLSSLVSAVLGLSALAFAPGVHAQQAVDPDAQSVLAAMSNYLGSLKSFEVEYAAADEIVTPEGQKLQFLHSGEVTLKRPDKLHVIRRGAAGIGEIFLDGKKLSFFGKALDVYVQLDASSIDVAVEAMRKMGFDASGADFLAAKPLNPTTTDMISGTHVGMTYIDGVQVHQLAFRGKEVDWQLWVTADNKPLPVRYVVTTKWFSGSPQFTLDMKKWNTAPQVDAARFTFVAPEGAKRLDATLIEVNAIGDIVLKGK